MSVRTRGGAVFGSFSKKEHIIVQELSYLIWHFAHKNRKNFLIGLCANIILSSISFKSICITLFLLSIIYLESILSIFFFRLFPLICAASNSAFCLQC